MPKTSAPRLTPQQRRILRLVADGLTSREIGCRLKLSPRTIEVHRYNVMRRLKVHNVAQLIGAAYRHGMLTITRRP